MILLHLIFGLKLLYNLLQFIQYHRFTTCSKNEIYLWVLEADKTTIFGKKNINLWGGNEICHKE